MVVKKHELLQSGQYHYELSVLASYIQQLNQEPGFIPPVHELAENCKNIVHCLASTSTEEENLSELLSVVEEFLLRIVTTVHPGWRHEVVATILDRIYAITSDSQSNVSAVTSAALVVCNGLDNDQILAAARELIQQEDTTTAGGRLRNSLSYFYHWICEWQSTAALGDWLLAFIQALEEKEEFDVLIEVSLDNLSRLFMALGSANANQSTTDVIFHVMASLRETKTAFDKIAPHVNEMLLVLASDNRQWSRQLLQNVVDVAKNMIENCQKNAKQADLVQFNEKYSDVIARLEEHMATTSCSLLHLQPWHSRVAPVFKAPVRKAGFINLGNTCYMNSVLQALYATKLFSRHVVMGMSEHPYWAKLGALYSGMMFPISTKINPHDFYTVAKPPSFGHRLQHDCTEFLSYLLNLLISYENQSEANYDYRRPAVITCATPKSIVSGTAYSTPFSESPLEAVPSSSSGSRSDSPSPCSSKSGASGSKRSAPDDNSASPNKRQCVSMDTFVDQIFGGILLTRVHCSECQTMSASYTNFRDLQLAFPDPRKGIRMSVQGLIDFYCASELMTGSEMYQCCQCNGLRPAVRVVCFESTPKYLVVVLKNFKYDQKLSVQKKLMLPIFYNVTVTLPTQHPGMERTYTMYASIIHDGTAVHTGHYYTLAKDNDQWYTFNDDKVTMVRDDYLQHLGRSSTPYVLFYRRTDVKECHMPTFDELPRKFQEQIQARNKAFAEAVQKIQRTRPLLSRSKKDQGVFN
ncbi:ubiquitin carboxyl-terminal hydrolase 38-like isoform X2 [Battus philenor]|uniref:ubiquitin carboxyl-terminal hydrolase 38-like isoform X2 n=1 Tax=Battus philenor TaxID=42288 RepID=UPI0035CFC51E